MPKLAIDPAKLTLGDLEDFEEATGTGLLAVFESLNSDGLSSLKMKDLTTLIWIVRRSDDPDFTLAQARRMSFGELQSMEFELTDSSADPTPGSE